MDLKLLHRNVGQLILVSGTVDDIIGWTGLSVVTAMATTGLRAANLVTSPGYLLAFVVVAAFVGRPVVGAAMRFAARSPEPGATIVLASAVMVLCGAVTQVLGVEAIFGGLVAGILIRASGPEVLKRLAALRTLVMSVFAPIFFAIAGLRMDLTALSDQPERPARIWLAWSVVRPYVAIRSSAEASGCRRR